MRLRRKISRKRQVLFVVTSRQAAELFVHPLARQLSDRGERVLIVADLRNRPLPVDPEAGIAHVSIRIERDPRPLLDLAALMQLVLLLRRIRPELVVYATPKASLLASVATRLVGTPNRIYLQWGLRLETSRGVARLVYSLLERLIHQNSTLTIANSKSLAREYVKNGFARSGDVEVVGLGSSHGVDLERFSRDAAMPSLDKYTATWLEENNERVVFGYVGRLNPDKGIDTLRAALDSMPADAPVALMVVGGSDGDTTMLEHPTIAVHHVGFVEDPRPYLAKMEILVLPSRREGFPNVVLEAASMGLPAIVSNSTGCVDSVMDGRTGLVVPVDDAERLARAILTLASDGPGRSRLGLQARRWVEHFFAQETVVNANLDRILKEVDRDAQSKHR